MRCWHATKHAERAEYIGSKPVVLRLLLEYKIYILLLKL